MLTVRSVAGYKKYFTKTKQAKAGIFLDIVVNQFMCFQETFVNSLMSDQVIFQYIISLIKCNYEALCAT